MAGVVYIWKKNLDHFIPYSWLRLVTAGLYVCVSPYLDVTERVRDPVPLTVPGEGLTGAEA